MGEPNRRKKSLRLNRAQRRLFDDHVHLVGFAIAWGLKTLPRSISREQIEAAAMRGLAQAAKSFDPSRGIKFATYAANQRIGRIYGEIRDELRETNMLPKRLAVRADKPRMLGSGILSMADKSDEHEGQERFSVQSTRGVDSVVQTARPTIDTEDVGRDGDAKDSVEFLLKKLNPIERKLIRWCYLNKPPLRWADAAARLDVDESRVSQIIVAARRKMRRYRAECGL